MKIPKLDHRDRDFLKTFKFAGVSKPTFPDEYDTDAGLWTPNQSEVNPEFPNTPPQPYGCTNYTSSDLAADLDGKLYDPGVLEQVTHANALGGYDVRKSLLAAKSIGFISGFYNIKAYQPLDYFDAIRLASFSGLPEKRSVSVGTPWYGEWAATISGATKNPDGTWSYGVGDKGKPLMPMPSTLDYTGLGWHNWKIQGWKTINGSPWLVAKPWIGKVVGDNGRIYFDRATINAVMTLKFTIAFTATHITPKTLYTVDMAKMDELISRFKTLFGLRY